MDYENLQYYVSLFWRNADRIIWLCSGHVNEVQIRLIQTACANSMNKMQTILQRHLGERGKSCYGLTTCPIQDLIRIAQTLADAQLIRLHSNTEYKKYRQRQEPFGHLPRDTRTVDLLRPSNLPDMLHVWIVCFRPVEQR